MNQLTLDQLRMATGGRWLTAASACPAGDAPLGRAVIDSREAQPGDVFWALRGAHCDGAAFVPDAFRRGAVGAVVATEEVRPAPGHWALQVRDTQQALHQAARSLREKFDGSVIAVTGSVGKTTTRQMIHTVLGAQWSGTASPRNYNNQLGVPLSMLGWRGDEDYAVLELGASHLGEIAELAALCRPQIGVITRIAEAHLDGFGSRHAVAEAKTELLQALPADGLAVLNGDDPELVRLRQRSRAKILWVGRGPQCDLSATNIQSHGGRLSLDVDGQRLHVPVWGRHHVTSILAAFAIGKSYGLPSPQIAEALAEFEPLPMRCEVIGLGGAQLINDSYNASPAAMRAALELLRDFDAAGRRIVVCGDMRELGDEAVQLHRELGTEIVTLCGADLLVACGNHAADVVAGAQAAGMPSERTIACCDPLDAVPHVQRTLSAGDVVLVKGSRAVALERIVSALQGPAQRAAA
ncbi:MAG TPA: UDP-N-acetylmuramoyl-tripeptide--D-alanyl-D-alanine ligase [Pirellulales bacterium]|nr:UDP-N-acetylmuramoyl-tripeptide--D-alanyl-D-alanine ligase [Pirellulales bacterium]